METDRYALLLYCLSASRNIKESSTDELDFENKHYESLPLEADLRVLARLKAENGILVYLKFKMAFISNFLGDHVHDDAFLDLEIRSLTRTLAGLTVRALLRI